MPGLENLNDVDWAKKAVASGAATVIPEALSGLVAADPKVRERSYWQLDNEIVLQGDLYEAAYFAIPYLLDCLRQQVPDGRDRIYDLLFEIANGEAPSSVSCETPSGDKVPLKRACREALMQSRGIFRRDTGDPDVVISGKARQLEELLNQDADEANRAVA